MSVTKPTANPWNDPYAPKNIPIFLDIDTVSNTDTMNMSLLNTSRGTIVPAQLDGSGNIINHPTAFYILCTTKAVGQDAVPALIPSPTYLPFGLVAGNPNVFQATNANNSNIISTKQFGLSYFNQSLNSNINYGETTTSPGMLVPVYCCIDNTVNYDGNYTPPSNSFFFFRADVFYEGPNTKMPDRPLQYLDTNFPSPYGKNFATFYLLSSIYTPNSKNQTRVASWSAFLTESEINTIGTSTFMNKPNAAKVSIAFNNPVGALNSPVKSLNTSTLYTVHKMNQYNTSKLMDTNIDAPWKRYKIYNWDGSSDKNEGEPDIKYNVGYPLNFYYFLGKNENYSKTTDKNAYYQNVLPNKALQTYQGTMCQTNVPSLISEGYNITCSSNYWDLQSTSSIYQGIHRGGLRDDEVFNLTFTENTNSFRYSCYCNPADITGVNYYAACRGAGASDGNVIEENGVKTNNNGYYKWACNSVHTGIYQFSAFQFVPINFFNTPSAGTVPEVYPLGERAYTGKVGPTGLTGNYVAPSTGTPQSLPIGPTGDGNAVITFPFNTDPKASNGWPTPFVTYNIPDSSLITDTIANWYQNPLNASVNCPTQTAPDNPYCTYQNYYQALLGKFYIKPTEAPSNLECGSEYAPPAQYWTDQGLTGPAGGCPGTSLCVPNYEYLKNIANSGELPFVCQEPTFTDPYPMSYNGFNYTDPYNITPITWQNMNNYVNGIAKQGISSTPQNYKQIAPPPSLQDIVNHDVNPVTNVTQKESETTLPFFLVLAIIGIIAFVCVIIYIIYKGNKSTEKDIYNPNTQMNYRRVY